jgi:ADP-heptose:LPS heptosyltransferase
MLMIKSSIMKKYKTIVLKYLLFLLSVPFRLLTLWKNDKGKKINTILVVRLDHIGDVIMTTPAFRALKEEYPNAKVYALISTISKELLLHNNFIDKIFCFDWPWPYDTRNNRFTIKHFIDYLKLRKELLRENIDLMIDFRSDVRFYILFGILLKIKKRVASSRLGGDYLLTHVAPYIRDHHEQERIRDVLQAINVKVNRLRGELFLDREDWHNIENKIQPLANLKNEPYVVLCPKAEKKIKEWTLDRWSLVAAYLFKRYNLNVIVCGTNHDVGECEKICKDAGDGVYNMAGRTSLRELAALLGKAELVIGIDGGPLHIASCYEIPIIALFGPTRPQEFRPYSSYARIIEKGICICDRDKHLVCNNPINGKAFCMDSISTDDVRNAIDQIMGDKLK